MRNEPEPVYFLGSKASPDDPRLRGRLGSDIGMDETGQMFVLQAKYRGQLDDVLRLLGDLKLLDLSPQPITLLCKGDLLLQESKDSRPEDRKGRKVREMSEEEIWDSKFLRTRRKRAESRRIDRTLGESKLE